jgi:L-threonylcarbamoyladenylate synthase
MKKNTMIIQVDTPQFDRDIERAATLLKKGENVAFPTETVYGLGGNAFDEQAILGIYEAKGRPSDNPLIVHISNKKMLEDLAIEIQPYVWHLIEAFWPGPLTVVLKKKQAVSSRVTGGLDTVAVRMPNHPVALKLIELAGVPVAAPSANLSGRPSPTKAAYVIEDLTGRVACIVAGEACEIGLESTVLDVTGENPVILRPGSVTQEQIESVVGTCEVDPALRDFS